MSNVKGIKGTFSHIKWEILQTTKKKNNIFSIFPQKGEPSFHLSYSNIMCNIFVNFTITLDYRYKVLEKLHLLKMTFISIVTSISASWITLLNLHSNHYVLIMLKILFQIYFKSWSLIILNHYVPIWITSKQIIPFLLFKNKHNYFYLVNKVHQFM